MMKRRAFSLVMLTLLISSGLPSLMGPGTANLAAWAKNGEDDGADDSGGDDHSGGGSDDGGDDGGGDDDGSDDHGNDDGGGSDSGDGSGSNSGNGASSGGSDHEPAESRQGNIPRLFGENGMQIVFANGAVERLIQGQYERLDRRGKVIEQRRATNADKRRLTAFKDEIHGGGATSGVQSVIIVKAAQTVQIVDIAGWTEKLERGRYLLTDPKGNVVTKRRATDKDVTRIRTAIGLR